VARVVAFVPDLLFGSSVVAALTAGGHEPVLATDGEALVRELPGAELLIVDLTFDVSERIDQVRLIRPASLPILAFYSHVEADVRDRAQEAGFDLVVPRSLMAREGAALVERLLAPDQ
jgi:CheY-like chemotaxis protein